MIAQQIHAPEIGSRDRHGFCIESAKNLRAGVQPTARRMSYCQYVSISICVQRWSVLTQVRLQPFFLYVFFRASNLPGAEE